MRKVFLLLALLAAGCHNVSGPFAHRVPVVAALDHPFRSGAAGDDADVMAPHDHDSDGGPPRIAPDRGPIAREP